MKKSVLYVLYQSKYILVFLFLLHGLVGVQLPQIPDQQTAAIGRPFSSTKKIITPTMKHPHFIFMTLQDTLNFKRDEIPDSYCFLASCKEKSSLWVYHNVFNCPWSLQLSD